LARQAGEIGGTLPAVMNAANEVAVDAFLNGRVKFTTIWHHVEKVMEQHQVMEHPSLDQLIDADSWARGIALLS
jgi:1-deoxy-D-xylulose-5-phosphate reductoisomerase